MYCFLLFCISCKNEPKTTDVQTKQLEIAKAAANDLKEKVSKNPDSVGLRFKYISVLDSIKEYKTALSELDSLILHDKANYALWFKKAQISEHASDTVSAIRYYTTATSIYPAPDGLLALANLYAEKKDSKTLIICQQLDEMRLGREMDAYVAFFAGVYYARTGNAQKAMNLFDQSIASNYTFMDAYLEKGYVFYDSKKYKEALDVFTTATTVKTRFAQGYYWQGKCLEAQKDKAAAIAKYQQAILFDNSLEQANEAIKRLQ